jgi:quercetin dioxygenase-like cupin family protein
METREGVRDLKAIYPETGFPTKSLILGVVEIDPGFHSPLHRHNCEEVYYVAAGSGYIESDGERHRLAAGDAVFNREGSAHRVFNDGAEPIRLVVVAGIMFVPLVPEWPSASPYELLEGGG